MMIAASAVVARKEIKMAIHKGNLKTGKIRINLAGQDGNAFCLLAIAKNLAKQLKIDPKPILDEMKSGDYKNLLVVFDNHFGQYVDLYNAGKYA